METLGKIIRKRMRESRADRRRNLRRWGKQPRNRMRAFRIQVTKYQIPEWLRAKAIKGLTSGPDYLWIKGSRLKAWMVARERELGSEPEVIEVEIRKCPICGKLQLAGDAREQRSRLERYYGESIPCDPDCVVRTNFKRGIK